LNKLAQIEEEGNENSNKVEEGNWSEEPHPNFEKNFAFGTGIEEDAR